MNIERSETNLKQELLKLGKWIGRGEAFGANANYSLFAQAKCWKEIHDSETYKEAGLTWDDFCTRQLHLSRPRVEALIANADELGQNYFRLSEIMQVSPETYRAIAPRIAGDAIEIDGVMVPIAAEHAGRIRAAVNHMRAELRRAREKPPKDPFEAANSRLEGCVVTLSRLSQSALEAAQKDALRKLIESSVLRLMEISESLAA